MAALALWLAETFSTSLWNDWTEFNETWQEARSQCSLPSLCFWGRSEKQNGCPALWLAETCSTSPLKLLNGIQRNLKGSKISTFSTEFVFFRPIGKRRWPPWPLIGWDIFDFSSETTERNSTKLVRKQDINVFYQVCVFGPIGKTRWPPWPLIRWDIFDFSSETAEQNSSKIDRKQDLGQRPLPSLWGFFLGRSAKQDGHPGQSVKKVAHCTQVHDMLPCGPLVIDTRYRSEIWIIDTYSYNTLLTVITSRCWRYRLHRRHRDITVTRIEHMAI